MVATSSPPTRQYDGLLLRYRGHDYPDLEPRQRKLLTSVYEISSPKEEVPLEARLARSLWERLPYAALPNQLPNEANVLVRAYDDSLNMILGLQRDVVGFVHTLCESSLDFRQESGSTNEAARDQALQARVKELVGRIGEPFDGPRSVLDGQLVVRPIEELNKALSGSLKSSLHQFGQQIVKLLQTLVDQQLAGVVEWFGEERRACQYHYFKHTVLQENDGSVEERTSTTFEQSSRPRGLGRRIIGNTHVKDITAGRHVHRWGRYTHHVMNAFHTTIQNTQVVMPPNVQTLVRAIPEWLTGFVRIIDGEIIRQQIVECDFRVDAWQEVQHRDIPIYGCEPAVIIDQFVLTGWGPMEVAAEQERLASQKADDSRRQLSQRSRWQRLAWSAAVLATGVAAIWTSSMLMPALFLFATIEVIRCHGNSVGHSSRLIHYFCGMILAVLGLSAAMLLRMGAEFTSLADILIGFTCALLAVCGLFRMHRLWPKTSVVNL